MEGTRYVNIIDGVAVIDLIGAIFPRSNMMTMSGATSLEVFTKEYFKAYNDPNIRGIVPRIDSPGGDVRGVPDSAMLMWKMARKGKKPVHAYAEGYMASAAYYLGATAPKITASRSALIGSIGVVLKAQKSDKDTIEIVSSVSPMKRADPFTEEGREPYQQQVDDLGEMFVSDVEKFRAVSREKVLSDYGKGSTFVGPRAKSQGLVDAIGTLDQVIESVLQESTALKSRTGSTRAYAEGFEWAALENADPVGDMQALLFASQEEEEEFTMGLQDLFNKLKKDKTNTVAGVAPSTADETESEPTATEGDDQAPTLTREQMEDTYASDGELFAERMTTDSRIWPKDQAGVACELINAKIDDAMFGGTVKFVDENGELAAGTREAMIRAKYASMPKHTMAQQAIVGVKDGSVKAKVLAETEIETVKTEIVSEDTKNELLALTEQGRKAIASRK
jgi:ClpP class serine protease